MSVPASGSQCLAFTKASSRPFKKRSRSSDLSDISEARDEEGCGSDNETPDEDVDQIETVESVYYQQIAES